MTLTRKLFLINFSGACLVVWAWWSGELQQFSSVTIAPVLAAVFIYGVASSFLAAARISKAISQDIDNVLVRTEHLDVVVKALFILAVMGTAWGIYTAFGSVSAESMSTPEGAREAGGKLLSGAGAAYGSSLIGLSLALWMMINVRSVHTAAAVRASEL